MKVCARCKEAKPPRAFYSDRKNQSYCRQCTRAYSMEWQKRFPHKRKAHKTVAHALKWNLIQKPTHCTRCGKQKRVVAHHEDYTQPLDVMWLCDVCHALRHVELGRRLPRTP